MSYSRPVKQFAGVIMGLALCVSSTAAGAATTPASSISLLVALSAFGTQASASAVRPVIQAPSAATLQMTTAAVQGDYDDDRGGMGWLPALLGLALLIAVVVVILNDDDDGRIDLRPPVSPN